MNNFTPEASMYSITKKFAIDFLSYVKLPPVLIKELNFQMSLFGYLSNCMFQFSKYIQTEFWTKYF